MHLHSEISTSEFPLFSQLERQACWYAVQTRSNFERQVEKELAAKGFVAYLPQYDVVHQWKDRKKKLAVPLFPGYLFARFCDAPARRLHVLQARGVVRVLGNSNGIEPVSENQIVAIRRLLESKLPCSTHPFLLEGMRVRVKRGPLAELEGILVRVKNRARLVISIPLLSQSAAVEVELSNVEPVGGGRPFRQ